MSDRRSTEYVLKSLVAGGIAGCAAKTVVAPLDRVKILFQTSNPLYEAYSTSWKGLLLAMQKIKSTDGTIGWFKGHSATLLRIFPYAAIKFMAYEQYKGVLMPTKSQETHFKKFLAGSLAGCTSVIVSYPLDLLRVRLAFESRPLTLRQVAVDIWKQENSLSPKLLRPLFNFYRGFMPTLYGMIPYAGVSFYTYETLKSNAQQYTNEKLSVWATFFCGGVSGFLAQTISYPFEVIRRQMQVSKETTTLKMISSIYRKRGFQGFFVGLSIGYIKVMPMFAVSFYTYEYMKQLLHI